MAHNHEGSFNEAISETFKKTTEQRGHQVEGVNLYRLKFNPVLTHKKATEQPLEPDLQMVKEKISEADHLVFVYPVWWGTMPAILKGFFDRTFISDFAFKYDSSSAKGITGLLTDKSASVFITLDTPLWYYKFFFKKPAYNQIKKTILQFCGINPVTINMFSVIKHSTEKQRKKWLNTVQTVANRL